MTRFRRGRVAAATALFLWAANPVGAAPSLDVQYDLDVAVSSADHTISGTAHVTITNRSNTVLSDVMLVLYPNRYRDPDPSLDHAHIQVIYPRAFNPGAIELTSVTEETGEPLEVVVVDEAGSPAHTTARVVLPLPLEPDRSIRLTIGFVTTVPEKLGVFGYVHGVTVMKGGWYPHVSAFRETTWATDLLPDQSDVLIRLTAPQGLVVAGAQLTEENPQTGLSVWTSRSRSTTASLAFSTDYQRREEINGDTRVSYLFLPADRRYVTPIMDTLHHGLAFFRKEYGDGMPREIVFAEGYLHQELVSAHENVSLISTRLFKVFRPLKKYHEATLVKGLFLALWRARLPDEETWVLEGLAEAGSQLYIQERYQRSPNLLRWLKPFSFHPVVDQILYSRDLPLRQVYFHETTPIIPREDPALFNNNRLDGTSMFFKLATFFGQETLNAILHRYVELIQQPPPVSFRSVVQEVTGRKIDWFYHQWLTVNPSTDYAISTITRRQEPDGYHTKVELTKTGQGIEPVTIRLTQQHGPALTTRWFSYRDAWTDIFVTPSPITAVELDPEHVTSDFERFNNRRPPGIKFILDKFPGVGYDFQTGNLSYDFSVYFQRRYDDRNVLRFTYARDDTATSGGTVLSHSFDQRVFSFSTRQSISLGASYTKQNVPLASSTSTEPYTALHFTHIVSDAKAPLIYSDEVQRLLFGAFPYSTLATAFSQKVLSSDNDHSHAVKLVLDVRRQWPVATLHEIAGRLLAGQSFGGFDEERRFTLGGNGGMRGYSPTTLSGESIVLASLEYRWPVFREIDDNIGGLTVLRRLQAAIFADVGTVSSYRRYRTDLGFGVRITHDVLGLYPVVARFDVAFPINVEAALKADEQNPHYYFTAGQPF